MDNNNIIQFVSFITELAHDEFVTNWEIYARQSNPGKVPLLFQLASGKAKYKYISRHEFQESEFLFAFKKGKNNDQFPELRTKIVQAGGYSPVFTDQRQAVKKTDLVLLLFVSHNEPDTDIFKQLSPYRYLNIYQAYYESCTYGHILEICVAETEAPALLQQLEKRPGVETAVYHKCRTGIRALAVPGA